MWTWSYTLNFAASLLLGLKIKGLLLVLLFCRVRDTEQQHE